MERAGGDVPFVRHVLPSGLRVLVAPMPHTRSATVALFYGMGSRYEAAAEQGIAHLVEHMLFKGSGRYPTAQVISETIEGVGAPPPSVQPPAGAGAPPASQTIDWYTGPMAHRGANGQRFTYNCPPNGAQGPLWGTGIHTDDSSVCTAAVHAGLITFASGGTVTIEIRPGQSSYPGSPGSGGVTSRDWGAYDGSFTVVGGGGAPVAPSGGGLPTQSFAAPMWGALRLDWCLVWGGQCGEPAASEFCRQSGYARAEAWEPAWDIGAVTPTFVLGTGQTCSEPGCDGFTSITCSR